MNNLAPLPSCDTLVFFLLIWCDSSLPSCDTLDFFPFNLMRLVPVVCYWPWSLLGAGERERWGWEEFYDYSERIGGGCTADKQAQGSKSKKGGDWEKGRHDCFSFYFLSSRCYFFTWLWKKGKPKACSLSLSMGWTLSFSIGHSYVLWARDYN